MGWLKRQRGEFPEVTTNWGRHHLGSLGRELTDIPNLIGIQLGHYKSTGYVFSPDSPMIPGQFVRLVNPLLDQIFRDQKWRMQSGLARHRVETRRGSPAKLEDSWARTGPIVDWEHVNQEFARQAKRRNLLVRRSRWAKQHRDST
ncbi:MAG: hypothetical protein U5L08_07285 [Xanthomonadales bacterium]|nr:hypothetical protein [Xanthomonadales bacterium]